MPPNGPEVLANLADLAREAFFKCIERTTGGAGIPRHSEALRSG